MDSKSDWVTVPIKEVAQIFDGPHATPKTVDEGPIFLGINSLNRGRLDLSNTKHVTEKDFKLWTRRVTPQANDIVFSYETRIGEAAILPDRLKCCLGRRMALVRTDPNKLDPKFFLYSYLSPEYQGFLKSKTIQGSTVERLLLTDFPNFPISFPPLPEQKFIATTLSCLDEKISLNQRINDTLEGIAQALFKSWFVDFDPVKAKAEGREPEGIDDAIASLFPSAFTESILGPIPEGWAISEIGKEVEVVGGSTPSTQEVAYWEDGEFYWATPKDLSKLKSPILLDTERKITQLGMDQISSGQLPIDTVLLSSRAPVGYIALAKVPVSINQGFIAMKCNKKVSPYFVINWTYQKLDEIKARATGTTFAEISKSVFRPIKVIVPNESIIQRFDDIAKPIYDRITENERNMSSLISVRDLLLPHLISGKLRVNEISETVEALAS